VQVEVAPNECPRIRGNPDQLSEFQEWDPVREQRNTIASVFQTSTALDRRLIRSNGRPPPGFHILMLRVVRIESASRNCSYPDTPPISSDGVLNSPPCTVGKSLPLRMEPRGVVPARDVSLSPRWSCDLEQGALRTFEGPGGGPHPPFHVCGNCDGRSFSSLLKEVMRDKKRVGGLPGVSLL